MSDSDRDLTDLLLGGLSDYIGLWELKPKAVPAHQVREVAIATVQRMLLSGYFQTGRLTHDGGFVPSEEGPEWTIQRIRRDWAAAPDPGVYEMSVWFALTPEGEARAKTVPRGGGLTSA